MKVIRRDEPPVEDRTSDAIMIGGQVRGHSIVGKDMNGYYNFTSVSFEAGARTRFHAHSSDQVLYVTEGAGIVADESQEIEIKPGDTAWIPAGEKHWHGAGPDSSLTHISLQTADSTTEILE
jgi:quercetin dioxygenase-like cupin family protein